MGKRPRSIPLRSRVIRHLYRTPCFPGCTTHCSTLPLTSPSPSFALKEFVLFRLALLADSGWLSIEEYSDFGALWLWSGSTSMGELSSSSLSCEFNDWLRWIVLSINWGKRMNWRQNKSWFLTCDAKPLNHYRVNWMHHRTPNQFTFKWVHLSRCIVWINRWSYFWFQHFDMIWVVIDKVHWS